MNTNHQVISAFLDDEPFEPQALAEALADSDGRDLLIDFVLLRHVAQSDDSAVVTPVAVLRSKRPVYLVAAAAAVLALLGGYQLGLRRSMDDSLKAPAATRVVQSEPVWQELGGGR
jgi:hypothetical protein